MSNETDVILAEAKAFGAGKEGDACVTETLSRLKACDGRFVCKMELRMFLVTCLEMPAPTQSSGMLQDLQTYCSAKD